MDNSSDESFAWTNASNSSDSSLNDQKMTKHNGTVNGLDDDSDYGASYKKKLHKKILLNNSDNSNQAPEREKKVKRKRIDDETTESPKKKKIKLEPESDSETPKKKRKKKLEHSQSNESYDGTNEDMSQDSNNLNISVKKEPGLLSPTSQKSKKHRKSEINLSMHSNNDVDETTNVTQDTNCSVNNDESYSSKKKKKKSKKKHSSQSDDDMSTEVEHSKDLAESKSSYLHQEDVEQKEDCKTSITKNVSFSHKVEGTSDHETTSDHKSELSSEELLDTSNLKSITNNKSTISTTGVPEKIKKRVSSISERIKFEHEDNSMLDCSISNIEKTSSKKLKKFLKINENLRPVTKRQGDWVLSADDEVWAIRCPHDIDINAFIGVKIKLDKKSKIKVEGQTYEGTMNNETNSLTVLNLEDDNYVVKKLPLKGTLQLRKKIPKVHIQENNLTADNQMDFVPMPVTKSRHPLFGSDYKKAMKVPSAIAERLKDPYNDTICDNEGKKTKKKKNKNKSMEVDNELPEKPQETATELDESIVKTKKKNKKRKHETDGEHSNAKRSKHNDSTAVWESEQAIEENLFNF